jgi:hypothetical protein
MDVKPADVLFLPSVFALLFFVTTSSFLLMLSARACEICSFLLPHTFSCVRYLSFFAILILFFVLSMDESIYILPLINA